MTSIRDEIDNFQFKLLSDLINSNIYESALRWCKTTVDVSIIEKTVQNLMCFLNKALLLIDACELINL